MFPHFIVLISVTILHVHGLLVERSGIDPLNPGDIAILFWLTVTNEAMEQVRVEARGERCCDAIDPFDPAACDFMRLTGGQMGTWEPKESRNITLFYATVVPLGRHGHCEVELWYGNEGGETKALNHRVTFDTVVRTDSIPPQLEGLYDLEDVTECHSADLDPLQSCAPVDCRMKYGGVRPFWSSEKQRCVSTPQCTDLDQAFDPAANLCRDLRAGLSSEDEELLRKPGGRGQCAPSAPDEDFLYTPLVRCHHGQYDMETGLCACEPDWVSSSDNIADLQPSTFVVHMCTERKPSCPPFHYLKPILLGILLALLIAGLSLVLYYCWPTPAFCRKPTRRRRSKKSDGRGGEAQRLLDSSPPVCQRVPSCPGLSKSNLKLEDIRLDSRSKSNQKVACPPGREKRPCATGRVSSSPECNLATNQVFSLSRVSTPDRMNKSAPVSQVRRSSANLSSGSSSAFPKLKDYNQSSDVTGFHSSAPPPSIMKSGKSVDQNVSVCITESRRRISWAESTRVALDIDTQPEEDTRGRELRYRERSVERRRERLRERSREGSRQRSAERSRERSEERSRDRQRSERNVRARNQQFCKRGEDARDALVLPDESPADPAAWKVSVLWRSTGDRAPSVERLVGAGDDDTSSPADAHRSPSSQDEHTMAASLTAQSSVDQSFDKFPGMNAQWCLASRRRGLPWQHKGQMTVPPGYTMIPNLGHVRKGTEKPGSDNICFLHNYMEGGKEAPSSSYGTFTVCECVPNAVSVPRDNAPKPVSFPPAEERPHKYVVGVRPVGDEGWVDGMQGSSMEVNRSSYHRDSHDEHDTAIPCESRVCRMCGRHVWIAERPPSPGGFLDQESEQSLVLCHLCTGGRSTSGSPSASEDSDTLNRSQMVYLTVQTHSVQSSAPEPIVESLPPCGLLTLQVREQTRATRLPHSPSRSTDVEKAGDGGRVGTRDDSRHTAPHPPMEGDEDDFWEQFMPRWKDLTTVNDEYDD